MYLMLEIAILGLLKESDLHGYELRRRLKDELGLSFSVSFGSLYPTLAKLTEDGCIEVINKTDQASDQNFTNTVSTGSLTGNLAVYRSMGAQDNLRFETKSLKSSKNKKIYRITSKGEEVLVQLLNAPAEPETSENETKNFTVKLAFSKYLPTSARTLLLKRRRQDLEFKLNELENKLKLPDANSSKIALMERSIALLKADMSWLDKLLNDAQLESEHEDNNKQLKTEEKL